MKPKHWKTGKIMQETTMQKEKVSLIQYNMLLVDPLMVVPR